MGSRLEMEGGEGAGDGQSEYKAQVKEGSSALFMTTLLSRPSMPGSVKVSQENVGAFMTGRHVTVVDVCSLASFPPKADHGHPRIDLPKQSEPLYVGEYDVSEDDRECVSLGLYSGAATFKQVAWSPRGVADLEALSSSNNWTCLLACVSSDGRVCVYTGPETTFSAHCTKLADISMSLLGIALCCTQLID